ncbi:hypothetical protein D3C87_1786490 [compost metagenome]
MTCQRQRQFVFFDAAAVIANADKLCAAAFDVDIDAGRARIKTVFDQFFHDRCRTLHHLTGGDLVRKLRRQNLNRHEFSLVGRAHLTGEGCTGSLSPAPWRR